MKEKLGNTKVNRRRIAPHSSLFTAAEAQTQPIESKDILETHNIAVGKPQNGSKRAWRR
jgi:hypothetical protein